MRPIKPQRKRISFALSCYNVKISTVDDSLYSLVINKQHQPYLYYLDHGDNEPSQRTWACGALEQRPFQWSCPSKNHCRCLLPGSGCKHWWIHVWICQVGEVRPVVPKACLMQSTVVKYPASFSWTTMPNALARSSLMDPSHSVPPDRVPLLAFSVSVV